MENNTRKQDHTWLRLHVGTMYISVLSVSAWSRQTLKNKQSTTFSWIKSLWQLNGNQLHVQKCKYIFVSRVKWVWCTILQVTYLIFEHKLHNLLLTEVYLAILMVGYHLLDFSVTRTMICLQLICTLIER